MLPASFAREVTLYTIEDFFDTVSIRGASFSADGNRILVSSDVSGIFNAYAIAVDGSGMTQLTTSTTESVFAVSYFPNDDRFLFSKDRGGNERTHVFVQYPDGRGLDLTPGEDVKAAFAGWADDKESFFLASNARDPQYFDLIEISVEDFSQELIFENNSGYSVADVSPDKRFIALQESDTRKNSYVAVHDRETGETKRLMTHEEDAVCSPQAFARDGKTLLCLTDMDHEFMYLVRENIETEQMEVLQKFDWDIQYTRLSKTGKYMVVGINEDSISRILLLETATGKIVELPEIEEEGVASIRFTRYDSAVAFYGQGGKSPGDLYYYRLGTNDEARKLTRRLSERIDSEDLVKPEIVRFASYDGVEVPGILYKPHQASADNEVPALVYVHGGPGGQTRASYNPTIQYLVNHGYAVFGINNRGSSGYGKTFYGLDDLKHGDADLDDCVASKKMLVATGYVDPERIGIMGGSYGGYMVCAALAFRPNGFEVGVNIFGVTNWVRTLKSIPSWWAASRNALYVELGDPFKQEEYLTKISPLFHAENIVKPMIVLQGANDARVLQVESDEMVAAVRANGVPVEYIVFPDEGHGFRKKENQIIGYRAVLKFLDEHLK
ncbi:MAG TPA: S9 family peptidase [Candidatus Hydrogenedentes bacterium]|nr:S9 family peptidase [Candidatus Hydrogenedentota bacterium]